MKKKQMLSILLALGLVVGAFAAALGPASADHPTPPEVIGDESSAHVYFPWVPNGSVIDETGPWYGTITLQNLEPVSAELDVYVGQDGGGFSLAQTLSLAANGSTTLSAADLDISSPGSSVKVLGWLSRGEVQTIEVTVCETIENVEECWTEERQEEVPAVYARIAGVAKQVADEPTSDGKTTSAHTIVDGYTGLNMDQVHGVAESIDGMYVLPIVQTNNDWNTHIRVANLGESGGSTPITVTLYEAGGQGADGPSSGEFIQSLAPGQIASFNIMDAPGVDEGWVGSAFITSNAPVGAVAERVKAETDMLIMNVSRPEFTDPQLQIAPLVFQSYNYWNTGISVANTNEFEGNSVTVSYFGAGSGPAGADQLNIPPRAMEYVYTPGTQDLGLGGDDQTGFVGSAVVSGTTTHHSVVDEVKYFGIGDDVGHAMSYPTEHDLATGAGMQAGAGDVLALPLFQKGNPATDTGDTSGIQFFNASADDSVTLDITIYDATGNPVAPTRNNPISQSLSPHQNFTLYAHDYSELPVGFQGSVKAEVSGEGLVTAISNNVNYGVSGDGSAAYNLVKVPGVPIEPVPSFFNVWPTSDENPVGTDHEILVTVYDQFGERFGGASVHAEVVSGPNTDTVLEWRADPDLDGGDPDLVAISDDDGEAWLAYTGAGGDAGIGLDTIDVTVDGVVDHEGNPVVISVIKNWVDGDRAAQSLVLEHVDDGDGFFVEDDDDDNDNTTHYVNPVDEPEHTVIATLTDQFGDPVQGALVTFEVEGENDLRAITTGYTFDPAGVPGVTTPGMVGQTNSDGQVAFAYVGASEDGDEDTISASAEVNVESNELIKEWQERVAASIELDAGDQYVHPEESSWDAIDVTATVLDQFGDEVDGSSTVEFKVVNTSADPDQGAFLDGATPVPGPVNVTIIEGEATVTYVSDRTVDERPLAVRIDAETGSVDPQDIVIVFN
jgi:hypothetical protein